MIRLTLADNEAPLFLMARHVTTVRLASITHERKGSCVSIVTGQSFYVLEDPDTIVREIITALTALIEE